MTTLNFSCKFCNKKYHWQGSDLVSDVVEHALLFAFCVHILAHHLREAPHPVKTFGCFFRELFFILVFSVLLVLRVLSFVLYPLYWLLSLLFE